MDKRVVLIRHGQSTWNTKSWIQGRSDHSVLTPKGEEQAQLCAQALAGVEFDGAYCSPLQRAHATARLIWDKTLKPLPELIEIDLPLWEGMTPTEAAERYPDLHAVYRQNPDQFVMAGRLPVVELWEQARLAWQKILSAPGHCLLVVGHNAINQALLATALGLSPRAFRRLVQSNGGISVLNFAQDGSVQLESMNQTAHLFAAPDGITLNFAPKSGQTRFLLVRHGETQWNHEGRFQGQMDIPLNPTGVAQAIATAQILENTPLDLAITSPLARSLQTAQAIVESRDLPLIELDDLREISHGAWEGKLHPQVEQEYPGLLQQWNTHPETVQMPEGENLQDIWQRVARVWQEHILPPAEGKTALVVAHDAINKALLCQVVGLGPEAFWRFKQGNGAVTVIDYIEDHPVLHSVNYTAGNVFDCTTAGAL